MSGCGCDDCSGITLFGGNDGATGPTGATGPIGPIGPEGPAGTIPGSGTLNYLARWTPDGATLGIGIVRDNGNSVGINASPDIAFRLYVEGSALNGANFTTTKSATNSDTAFGISGESSGVSALGKNIGVYGVASRNTNINYGVHGAAQSVGAGKNVGVYGLANNSTTANYAAQLIDGSEGVGKVLTCMTATGEANWVTLPTIGGLTWSTITGNNPTATLAANNGYVIKNTIGGGTTDLTLPSSGVVVGDIIKISATDGGGGFLQTWRILEGRAADVIIYSFYDITTDSELAGLKNTSPLLTFDNGVAGSYTMFKNQSLTLTCVEDLGTGYAWNIELANGKVIS